MQLVCFKDTQLFNVTLHQNSELDSLRLGLTFNTLRARVRYIRTLKSA